MRRRRPARYASTPSARSSAYDAPTERIVADPPEPGHRDAEPGEPDRDVALGAARADHEVGHDARACRCSRAQHRRALADREDAAPEFELRSCGRPASTASRLRRVDLGRTPRSAIRARDAIQLPLTANTDVRCAGTRAAFGAADARRSAGTARRGTVRRERVDRGRARRAVRGEELEPRRGRPHAHVAPRSRSRRPARTAEARARGRIDDVVVETRADDELRHRPRPPVDVVGASAPCPHRRGSRPSPTRRRAIAASPAAVRRVISAQPMPPAASAATSPAPRPASSITTTGTMRLDAVERSSAEPAAVDGQHDARDVVGGAATRGRPWRRRGRSASPQRPAGMRSRIARRARRVVAQRLGVVGRDVARGDRVDVDAARRPLVRERLGESGDAGLRGGVAGHVDAALEAQQRSR